MQRVAVRKLGERVLQLRLRARHVVDRGPGVGERHVGADAQRVAGEHTVQELARALEIAFDHREPGPRFDRVEVVGHAPDRLVPQRTRLVEAAALLGHVGPQLERATARRELLHHLVLAAHVAVLARARTLGSEHAAVVRALLGGAGERILGPRFVAARECCAHAEELALDRAHAILRQLAQRLFDLGFLAAFEHAPERAQPRRIELRIAGERGLQCGALAGERHGATARGIEALEQRAGEMGLGRRLALREHLGLHLGCVDVTDRQRVLEREQPTQGRVDLADERCLVDTPR